jgi:NAD-dependent dihydropyrimidine dehydrogenase PreA subunit
MFNSGKGQQNPDGKKNPSGFFDSYTETSLNYHPERCINCKRCTQVCPHGVFAEGQDHAELVRPSSCMECGACTLNCPVQAIEVQSGVGCAWAMIGAALRGKDMDTECSCGGEDGSCCGTPEEPSSCCGGP